ncbi:MAG: helix-turn-helix domain-containing protein, partial [Desulfovermiculus sp.]
ARELGIHRTLLYKKMKKHAVVSPAAGQAAQFDQG